MSTNFTNIPGGTGGGGGGGGGTVTGTGTANQIAVWTSSTGIAGYTGLTYEDGVALTIGVNVLPLADNSYAIGADDNRFSGISLSTRAFIGTNSPGQAYVYIEGSGGGDPKITFKTQSDDQLVLRGVAGPVLDLVNITSEPAGGDLLTFTNGPTGTAGNPDIYLHLMVSGVLYAFPGFAV